ncbi:MAG: eukaryotic-like serine/threonine-protein kinase [Acidobacteriota bacterium]|nr:eukaryotic-like serine/threonine-protein kinase [Acidobacteriota bacterium]
MGFGRLALTALGKVGVVLAVLVAFSFGLLGTIYLSLRTAEVKVPDVLGKDRFTAETMLDDAGLKIRVRGTRASAEKPDTILSQLPEAGQIVKAGIPVAVEVSRVPKEGESVRSIAAEPSQETEKPADNANQSSTATNQNQNQNKPPKNKNTNKNANNKNANNSNNANGNTSANRNANNRNANTTRNTNNGNRNANATPNANRTTNNSNTIRRPPIATPPFNPGANRGTP